MRGGNQKLGSRYADRLHQSKLHAWILDIICIEHVYKGVIPFFSSGDKDGSQLGRSGQMNRIRCMHCMGILL